MQVHTPLPWEGLGVGLPIDYYCPQARAPLPREGPGVGSPYDTFLQIMLIKSGDVNDLAMSNI
ncbi:hypothetical protein HMPREF9944_02016 [Segatella maculosa OT 289]|uniref:Uncharacterized protein n=1 Tax=Segatella maculosa OT 289 TaxID=999422 RepID=H1HPC2_9BACT|nr:hypothetical protein HMPREF9944_02016 [Segatella maculosa OT 289]